MVFRYALNPTKVQEAMFRSHEGAVRVAYNWCVNYVQTNWEEVKKNPEVEYVNHGAYALSKAFNASKADLFPWWKEVSKSAFQTGCANAAMAFDNWFNSRNGKRKGARVGFPKFKKRGRDSSAVHFTAPTLRLDDLTHFTLPRIGRVRLHEKAHGLKWILDREDSKITGVKLARHGLRWFIVVQLRVSEGLEASWHARRTKRKIRKTAVGVDLGLKAAYIFSDGEIVASPKFYEKSLRKLRREQRRLSRRNSGSNRRERQRLKVAKLHARIKNQRHDFINKATRKLVDDYELVAVESLNVKGMVRYPHLGRSVSDAGFGEFLRQIEYKARWFNSALVKVDRFFPSSKMCSNCKTVKAKLSVKERVFRCESCGFVIDRDVNAAVNILGFALAQGSGESLNGRGEGSADQGSLGETAFCETSSKVSLHPTSVGQTLKV